MDAGQATVDPYRYEFKTLIESDRAPKGLSEDTVRFFADNFTGGYEATAGAPDESLLFYLRANSLSEKSEKEAEALLIQAFVCEAIVDDNLHQLAITVASRWLAARG
jgi:Fe-S cluster assembly protein SufD